MADGIHHPVLARLIDASMRPLQKFRPRVVPGARGAVLEVGAGTGLNFPLYAPGLVTSVTAVEPDPAMRRRAQDRPCPVPVTLVDATAEALPFDDQQFDTAVLTFVLCTVRAPAEALAELRRVLRPGATVLFAEHVLSAHPGAARWQHRLTPLWRRCAGGCHLDRDAGQHLRDAGLVLDDEHRRGPAWSLSPVHYGRGHFRP